MHEVVKSGCQAVPKSDLSQDPFCWRLSFSRGEHILSMHVPHKAKLAFLAVKLAWKNGLKPICSKLKSYHLKTIFFHFLEKTQEEALMISDFGKIYRSLISFIIMHLENDQIPHFFIRSVNLLEKNPLINRESSMCVAFFMNLEQQEISNIFCLSIKIEMAKPLVRKHGM